jgi:hypothetical protein
MADVRGQPVARRALEIAAAGSHHLHACPQASRHPPPAQRGAGGRSCLFVVCRRSSSPILHRTTLSGTPPLGLRGFDRRRRTRQSGSRRAFAGSPRGVVHGRTG